MVELKGMPLNELKKLKSKVDSEISKREVAAKRSFLKRMQKMAEQEGFSLEAVIGVAPATKVAAAAAHGKRKNGGGVSIRPIGRKTGTTAARSPLVPRYAHPDHPEMVWSGRGRKPQWVADWLANGGKLDALLKG